MKQLVQHLLPPKLAIQFDIANDRHHLAEVINHYLDNYMYWATDYDFWYRYLADKYQAATGYIFVRNESEGITWLTAPF